MKTLIAYYIKRTGFGTTYEADFKSFLNAIEAELLEGDEPDSFEVGKMKVSEERYKNLPEFIGW